MQKSAREIVQSVLSKTTRSLDPCDWIETNFFIPELNGPIQLAPYQKAVLREAYRRDERGRFVYSTVIWSDIKKSIKSSIAAAVCLERASHLRYGSIKIVANDLKQADSRVAYYARRAVELNPLLRSAVTINRYQMRFPNKTLIEAIPIDPKGEAGGNDDFIVFSELWGAKGTAAERMWSELTLSPTKFGKSQRWVETYAGFTGESTILEGLYQSAVKEGALLDLGIAGLEVYANGPILCLWNTRPRLAWQTDDYYASEASVLHPSEFARMHRNEWQSSSQSFVPLAWWEQCRTDNLPPMGQYQDIVIALDAAVSNDSFGLVGVSRHRSPNSDNPDDDIIAVRVVQKWTPPPNGTINFDVVKTFIRDLCKRLHVSTVVYDPYQLHSFATDMLNEQIVAFSKFNQGSPRLLADKRLFDFIRDRRILHSNEADLREHVMNANAQISTDDHQLRIVKRSEHLKIDLAVCLSMAADYCMRMLD